MRSLKTTGGLTRGRGLTETQRLLWVLSSPACAEVNSVMQQFTSVHYTTSEQHKDVHPARVMKDIQDTKDLVLYLKTRNPFDSNPSLKNIASGVTAHATVNVDRSKDVGQSILKSIAGKKVVDVVFRKKDQAVTMTVKSGIKIRDETVQIDPQLLFQRLVTVGLRGEDLKEVLSYELCSYPPALFEAKNLMLAANKSTLADAM